MDKKIKILMIWALYTKVCKKKFIFKSLPSNCNVHNVELPIYTLLARKPSIINLYTDEDKVNRVLPYIFPLSTFSLVANKLPDTDI